jgi:hypothetical protein
MMCAGNIQAPDIVQKANEAGVIASSNHARNGDL